MKKTTIQWALYYPDLNSISLVLYGTKEEAELSEVDCPTCERIVVQVEVNFDIPEKKVEITESQLDFYFNSWKSGHLLDHLKRELFK